MRLANLFCVVAALGAAGTAMAQPATKAQSAAKANAAAKAKAAAPAAELLPLGPELWQGVRVGMSQEDVAARFPKATPSKGELLPNGSKSTLTVPTTAGGAVANAQFYFDANGLETVIIDRPDVVANKTDDNLAKAHKVIDEVTAAHGAPASCTEQRRLAALMCTWPLGEAKAVVSYRDVAGAAPSLSIAYRKLNDIKRWAPGPVKKLKMR